jgi:hypothetical protein
MDIIKHRKNLQSIKLRGDGHENFLTIFIHWFNFVRNIMACEMVVFKSYEPAKKTEINTTVLAQRSAWMN